MLLSRSPTHQFSIDKRLMWSIPFPSTVYCRIAPLTMNAKYLHTSPSCKKYCRFLNFLGTKVFLITFISLSESGVVEWFFKYFRSDSCIGFTKTTLCEGKMFEEDLSRQVS